jgi:hypothetical protein
MSATIHGGSGLYSLVEQPGSSFTTTRAGFDTGRRTFKCWQSVAATLEPLRGSPDSIYFGMKVDTVAVTFDAAGVATMQVSYLGIKNQSQTKEDEFQYSVTDETPEIREPTFDWQLSIPKPQVTRTFITRTLPTTKIGRYDMPLKYAELVPGDTVYFEEVSALWRYTFWFKAWRLIGRTIKNVADLYEITETHQWDFKVRSIQRI